MCSFGQGVSLTPLQLGAFVAALANGGTLYYLQHPTTPDEAAHMEPKVKRTLDIAKYVPDMQDGMAGAVEYGTARRLRANFTRAARLRQNRHLLRQRNPLRLVRLLLRFAPGQPGHGLLPRGRPAHLWPPRRRADRRVLQEPLGQGLLCPEGLTIANAAPPSANRAGRRAVAPLSFASPVIHRKAALGRLFCAAIAANL